MRYRLHFILFLKMNKSILVIDDSLTICLMLKSWLVNKGFHIVTATDVEAAKQMVKEQPFDLILTDIRMPDADGFTFLSWVRKYDSDILVIMMTGYADIESAVASMKSGAADYISKPIEPEQLFRKIEEAFKTQENRKKRSQFCDEFIIPPGEEYTKVLNQLDHIAEHNSHLLIIGDRGTGKASTVKYIHDKAFHVCNPLVAFDMDDVFNSRKNPRTSNSSEENDSLLMQRFNEAKSGLFYIRNVDQLDIHFQNELLNILTKQNKDDDFTQVIVSTEKHKEELQKLLIPKLYHMLEKNCVVLPTLKGKREVILSFISYFLQFSNFTLDKKIEGIEPAMLEQLTNYTWPGNIQELKNTMIKAALLSEGSLITAKIAPELFGKNATRKESRSGKMNSIQELRKENYEKEKILEALQLAKGNKTMAASILNIDRKTLYNKMKLYNVTT